MFDKWRNAQRREIFSDSPRAAASGGCSLDAPAGAVANQGKFWQVGCRPARKFNAERRKKIRRLGVLTLFKQTLEPVCVMENAGRARDFARSARRKIAGIPGAAQDFFVPRGGKKPPGQPLESVHTGSDNRIRTSPEGFSAGERPPPPEKSGGERTD